MLGLLEGLDDGERLGDSVGFFVGGSDVGGCFAQKMVSAKHKRSQRNFDIDNRYHILYSHRSCWERSNPGFQIQSDLNWLR